MMHLLQCGGISLPETERQKHLDQVQPAIAGGLDFQDTLPGSARQC